MLLHIASQMNYCVVMTTTVHTIQYLSKSDNIYDNDIWNHLYLILIPK